MRWQIGWRDASGSLAIGSSTTVWWAKEAVGMMGPSLGAVAYIRSPCSAGAEFGSFPESSRPDPTSPELFEWRTVVELYLAGRPGSMIGRKDLFFHG